MHLKTALFGLNFDAFEYSWDETGGATRIGLALLLYVENTGILQVEKNFSRSIQELLFVIFREHSVIKECTKTNSKRNMLDPPMYIIITYNNYNATVWKQSMSAYVQY